MQQPPSEHCKETQQVCNYQAPPSPQLWQASKPAEEPRSNNWRSVIFSSGSHTPDSFGDGPVHHETTPVPPTLLQSPPASQPGPAATNSSEKAPETRKPSFISQLPQRDDRIFARKSAAHDSQIVLDKTRILRWSHWMGAGQEFGPIFTCYMETLGPRQDSDLPLDAKAVLVDAAEMLQKCKRLARSSKIWRPSRLFGMQGYDLMPPSREVADVMATEYFAYFETTIRILHIPSFWKIYDQYWKNEETATMETRLLILMVVAIGSSLQDRSQASTTVPSIAQIHQWIYAAQTWLAGPLEKDRLALGGELRRRLWYTILELLIQGSLDTAMPPRISPDEYDTEPPSNINDCDFDEDIQILHPKPESVYTDTTLQRHLAHALPVRIKIVRYLNAIKTDLSYPEAMNLSTTLSTAQRKATLALQAFPDKTSPFQRNMVDFLLRRFVVPLHSPFACEARTTPTFHYSLKACTEASLALINPEPDVRFSRLLDFSGGLFREGLRSANTAISLDLIIQTKTQQADGTLHRTRTVRDALKRSVVDMLEICERRIGNGETNVKSYVFLAMVLTMTEAMENGEPCEMKIAQSARDALTHCYGILENSLGSFVTNTPTEAGFPSGGFEAGFLDAILISASIALECLRLSAESGSAMKVLISGAGISGTALVFWLSKLDFDVTVIERFPSLRTNGLQLDLRGHGIEVLRLMGLDAAFKEKAAPEQGLQFVDSVGRRLAYLAANTSGTGKQNFTSEYEIMRGDLCQLFHDASLKRGKVKYMFDLTIKELQENQDDVIVTFSDGQVETFNLIVGSDGQWSRTRRMMLGSTASPDPALHLLPGMYAGYFTTPIPMRDNEGFDSTVYLASRRRSVMTRRSDPRFLQVYMACSSDASSGIQTVRRGDAQQEKAAFSKSYRGAGWRVPELVDGLEASDDFYCERIGLVKLDAWHKGRVVLVGDAAYCPSVLTGMGTTCGIVGAYVLAGELSRLGGGGGGGGGDDEALTHSTLQDALAAYDARFRPFIDQVQDGIGEESLFSKLLMPSSAFGISVLNFCLRAMTFLGIRLSSSSLMKEGVKNWDLPQYKSLIGKI
ncbi:hypothetical protein MY5147_000793 [Beauveria neobassiana]